MKIAPQNPFGAVIQAELDTQSLADITADQVAEWIRVHRLIVIRGLLSPSDEEIRKFSSSLGTILEWEFGAFNELKVKPDTKNYLYTNRGVPFHWDGAFVGKIPHYIFFHCVQAPARNAGGETLFTDTTKILSRVNRDQLENWQRISIRYSTEKVVHYGGSFVSPFISVHPNTNETVIRFAEPVDDLNPVNLEISGLTPGAEPIFLSEMARILRSQEYCYAHVWEPNDIVIADNHALLHGRNPFKFDTERHLRRVNIL